MSFTKNLLVATVVAVSITSITQAATVLAPVEDVMTSGFFSGSNLVRGYDVDDRSVHRVATENPFGTVASETVYLSFDAAAIGALTGSVTATLTVQSADGGFSANAGPGSPFTVSAHAVDTDPLTAITDDTNPGGPIAWSDFYANNILAADAAAFTAVEAIDVPVDFDVTAVVNDWISGANTVFTLALTGKNDSSGSDFLHGFLNNSEAPGSTFLTITAVPEPTSIVLFSLFSVVSLAVRRKKA